VSASWTTSAAALAGQLRPSARDSDAALPRLTLAREALSAARLSRGLSLPSAEPAAVRGGLASRRTSLAGQTKTHTSAQRQLGVAGLLSRLQLADDGSANVRVSLGRELCSPPTRCLRPLKRSSALPWLSLLMPVRRLGTVDEPQLRCSVQAAGL